MKNLFFDYPDNSVIRFKKGNMFENDNFPYLYRIKTEKLDFTIPKKMVKIAEKHVYIPLAYYRNVLTNFYHKISNCYTGNATG